MKQIQMFSGKKILVDDEDFEWLDQFKWSTNSCNYPSRYGYIDGKRKFITIHRYIMNFPKNKEVDHINGNRLDNRRSNLRICNASQNCENRESSTKNTSGFRGVTKHENRWRARLEINGKKISLGVYKDIKDAALAYNQAATKHFGEFARLNQL